MSIDSAESEAPPVELYRIGESASSVATLLYRRTAQLPSKRRRQFLDSIENASLRKMVEELLGNPVGEDSSPILSAMPPSPFIKGVEFYGLISIGDSFNIYLALHKPLDRWFALERIRVFDARPSQSLGVRARWQHIGRISHPGIAQVLFVSEPGNALYCGTEYIHGINLKALIRDLESHKREGKCYSEVWPGPPSGETYSVRVARLICEFAEAINACHERGVVLGDLDSGSIVVDGAGKPHLVSFGEFRMLATDEGFSPGVISPYTSPEATCGSVDSRSDVFSIGVLLYEMLTLRLPFDAVTLEGLVEAVRKHEPPPVHRVNRDVCLELAAVCRIAMEKEPDRRYSSAGKLAEEIRSCVESSIAAPSAGPPSLLKVVVRRLLRVLGLFRP